LADPALGTKLLELVGGIVLIDEVDLHLHPSWQQQMIVGLLRQAFPQVQFIVTTHSPQVLSTVPPESIRVLRAADAVPVEYSEGLRSDVVLETILGTSPKPDVAARRQLDDYLTLVYDGRGGTSEARQLRQEIDARLGGVSNVRELADADAELAFAAVERGQAPGETD
jgi:predicted ATP-binding protein involved in virulence